MYFKSTVNLTSIKLHNKTVANAYFLQDKTRRSVRK